MGDQHPRGHRTQQIVEVAVPATRLIADFESIRQSFENSHHLIDRPHLSAVDELACLVEHTNRRYV